MLSAKIVALATRFGQENRLLAGSVQSHAAIGERGHVRLLGGAAQSIAGEVHGVARADAGVVYERSDVGDLVEVESDVVEQRETLKWGEIRDVAEATFRSVSFFILATGTRSVISVLLALRDVKLTSVLSLPKFVRGRPLTSSVFS